MSLCVIDVDSKIIEIRGTKVLLDSDVAFLYGVQTKEINQAVKNNAAFVLFFGTKFFSSPKTMPEFFLQKRKLI